MKCPQVPRSRIFKRPFLVDSYDLQQRDGSVSLSIFSGCLNRHIQQRAIQKSGPWPLCSLVKALESWWVLPVRKLHFWPQRAGSKPIVILSPTQLPSCYFVLALFALNGAKFTKLWQNNTAEVQGPLSKQMKQTQIFIFHQACLPEIHTSSSRGCFLHLLSWKTVLAACC